ncbi:MAG TPA: hypothetical protein VIM47_00935 [Dermatophilaceae bacterium]
MAITAKLFGLAIKSLANKEIDWDTDTVKAVLCSATYTPDQDAHQYASSLTNELAGGGYARVTLAGKTTTYTAGTNTHMLDAADFSFPALTGTFRYLIYLIDTGVAGTSPLVAYVDFGADQTATAQDVNITLDAAGVVSVVVA